MAARDKQPQIKHHEERQGGERDAARNQGILGFGNRRRVRDSPLNIMGEQHKIPVLPKGTLKEFFGDGTVDERGIFIYFLMFVTSTKSNTMMSW
jgi:hypothetical protein